MVSFSPLLSFFLFQTNICTNNSLTALLKIQTTILAAADAVVATSTTKAVKATAAAAAKGGKGAKGAAGKGSSGAAANTKVGKGARVLLAKAFFA